ncbi:MAG: hypothetical protein H6502_04030 [Candidatus Woesearchaeota archaeon]|nr:MAG: hypothetical protein H6502_04030 [Candidatus Woesearchaeota archaeon]
MGWFSRVKKTLVKEKMPFRGFSEVMPVHGSLENFEKKLLHKSLILLILGKRGSGKTATGMRLLEHIHENTKKKTFVLGYEETKLPFWVKKAKDVESLPNNTALLIDEGAVTFSSRDAMKQSNKYLGKLMAVARHKNLTLILVTQNSAMIDLNVLRLADSIIFKEPSLLQSKFERKAIKDLYDKVMPHFKPLKATHDSLAPFWVIMDDEYEGVLTSPLPSFWSDKVSTSYKNV